MSSKLVVEPVEGYSSLGDVSNLTLLMRSTPLGSVEQKVGVTHAAVNSIAEPNFTEGPNKVTDPFNVEIQRLPEEGGSTQIHSIASFAPLQRPSTVGISVHPTAYQMPIQPHNTAAFNPNVSPLQHRSSIYASPL